MPAKKITLVATFKDGSFSYRATTLDLKFGWKAFGHDSKGRRYEQIGFSGRRDLADKAARAWLSHLMHTPNGCEIVATGTVDAKEWKAELIRRQPFRISYVRDGDTKVRHIGGEGNQDARYATVFDAQAVIDRHAKNDKYATYTIVDDTPKPKAPRKRK